jgi:CTP:molybdopterin cytidylyltransferase MocA
MKKTFPNKIKTSALILAAGNSLRMGQFKFSLKFDDEFTFIEKIVDSYIRFGCSEIKIVLNSRGIGLMKSLKSKIIEPDQIVLNAFPEREKFFSIQTGLRELNQPGHVFIHQVDNPFAIKDVLNSLLDNCDKSDYQVPCYKGKGGHPILISGKVVAEICKINEYDINFRNFLERFKKLKVELDFREVLLNINTQEDYLEFLNSDKPI